MLYKHTNQTDILCVPSVGSNTELLIWHVCETSMNFFHNCGLELTLGNENFCPQCGTNLRQSKTTIDNNRSIGIQHTAGDLIGAGISGIGNITAKDTKGNILYFNIQSVSSEQNTIITSTMLDVSQICKE